MSTRCRACVKKTSFRYQWIKNKVEVGIPATSHRSKIRTFYLAESSPNYNDHDFPYANSKLVPAGYQLLQNRITRSRYLSPH